ncbi:SDR family oxidoreductase [Cohnella yongneupensis]|uniref:SDR family oxidoreductase n=1 Tax=Cohnella yongneupensis TaxID=425006 RepID=A0ABW0QW41_9BACL
MKNVLVLGATSGIAQEIVKQLANDGVNLVLAGRSESELGRLQGDLRVRHNGNFHVANFQATAFETHVSFFDECVRNLGHLDGIILCYGYMGDQQQSQVDNNLAKEVIDVNYTSCVSILHIAAQYFEARKSGFICAISSVAGDRGRQSNYIYGSAKGALSLFLQGLRNRLSKSGVNVLTVKPGFVDTKMTFGQEGLFLVAKPERVARDIIKAIRKNKSILYTPFFWKWIMLIIKSIPERIFKRLSL